MKINSKIKRHLHKFFGIYISMLLLLITFVINDFVSINIMLSDNISSILESTITFSSIVLGLSSALIGSTISVKSEGNRFINWYFSKVDRKTFVVNVMLSTISAFILIGSSIVLLSYDVLSDVLRRIVTCIWIFSLFSFTIYQISEYKLFLDILFFNDTGNNKNFNKPVNLSDDKKRELYNASKKTRSQMNENEIMVDDLIDQ